MSETIRLLYVEDNTLDQMAFERLVKLNALPYQYAFASNIDHAQAVLSETAFDVVLLDYQLEDGTGLELLPEIAPKIPTIFITGSGNEEIAVQAMKAGAIDYLVKDTQQHYLKTLPLRIQTALRQAEHEQLAQQLQREQMQTRLLREFIQSISHDLRTPLASLMLSVGLIQKYVSRSEESVEHVEEFHKKLIEHTHHIDRHAHRISQVIGTTTQMVRLDTLEALELNHEDLNGIIWDIVNGYKVANHQIVLNLAINALMVHVAVDELGCLVTQLLDNALRFTPEGREIRIATYRQENEIFLEIADTGVGIEPQKLPFIFDRLYQADESRKGGGGGLGLALVKRIVDLHHARIEVDSQVGQGTTFRVCFGEQL